MTAAHAAEELTAHRPMLFGLAYRLLGSAHDADDVLQEAYLRWSRTDRAEVTHPRRYLSRVVTRLALDTLRARQARREQYVGPWLPEPLPAGDPMEDQESLSVAMLHLLERLTPLERAVYVLRTAFGWPYAEIAEVIDRQPEHCRQLRRRASGAVAAGERRFSADRDTHQRLLHRFVRAAREGDVAGLARLLHDDAVAYSDGGGRTRAALNPVRGPANVARFFAGVYARYPASFQVRPVPLSGGTGVLVTAGDAAHLLTLSAAGDRISDIFLIANPEKLQRTGDPGDTDLTPGIH